MAIDNKGLKAANKAKADEFYTQYDEIQREVNAYLEYNPDVFRDKTIVMIQSGVILQSFLLKTLRDLD